MSNKKTIKKNKPKEKDKLTLLVEDTLKDKNIKLKQNQIDLCMQIFKFIIVGGIATIIDWLIYFILCQFVKIDPLISNIISFSVSVVYNYWASCKYVFNVTNKHSKGKQITVFIVLSALGLGINELLIFALNTNLHWNYMLVKILATIIVMIFNFITRKIYLEKK